MSFLATAVTTSVLVAGGIYQHRQQEKAQEEAQKQALKDERRAREAEVFAETEGKGVGQLGQISLAVDDDDEDDDLDDLRI